MSNIYLESDIISKLFSLLFSNRKSKCSFFQVIFQVPYYKKAITCKSNFTFMSLRFFYRYADFSEAHFKAFLFRVFKNRQRFKSEVPMKK